MNQKIILGSFLLIVLLIFSSCFKEDDLVVPQKPGDVTTVVIEMLPDYSRQSYFDLSKGEVVAVNDRTGWDLALSTSADNYTLYLNTSVFMYAAHTGVYDFNEPVSTSGRDWKFDASNGNPEENAIGKWWTDDGNGVRSKDEVILIDLGIDDDGFQRGILKIQPTIDLLSGEVAIRVAKPDGTNERTFEMPKDTAHQVVTLSLENGLSDQQPVPSPGDWDLLFTTYTTLLLTDLGEAQPYLVNGVLLNDTLVSVALDTIVPFVDIDRAMAESMKLSRQKDTIGYAWKEVNGDVTSGNVTYTINSNWSYIIRDNKGLYYKLRFIDFYNDKGKKGYPTFEFQRL